MGFWRAVGVVSLAELLVTALSIVWVDLAGRGQLYNAVGTVISAAEAFAAGYLLGPSRARRFGAAAAVLTMAVGLGWGELSIRLGVAPANPDGQASTGLVGVWNSNPSILVGTLGLLICVAAILGFCGAWLRHRIAGRTHNQSKAQPWGWRRRIALGVGGLALASLVFGGAVAAVGLSESRDPTTTADTWMRFLTTRQYRGVYNLSSPSLRDQFGTADNLQRWFVAQPERHPTTWSREGVTDDGVDVIVRGTASFEDGHASPIQVHVARINGLWRVSSFSFEGQ